MLPRLPSAVRVLAIATCVAASASLLAQQAATIRGTLVQGDGATAAPGVLVESHRASGALLARALSAANGSFSLRADTGVTELRALRIGYRPTIVRLRADTVRGTVTIKLESVNVSLAAVKVSTDDQCNVRGDTGQLIARAWEMARTALVTASVTEKRREVTAKSLTWHSWRDEEAGPDHWVTASVRDVASARPFISAPASQLATTGYAITDKASGEATYLGPDSDALISDEFAASHCFRLVPPDAKHGGSVGIAFRPTRTQRNVVDITGTFWLSQASGELQLLEYRYANAPPDLARANAGGRIEYARLASGDWVVNRWAIQLITILEHDVVERMTQGAGNMRIMQQRDQGRMLLALSGGELLSALVDGVEAYATPATTWRGAVARSVGSAGWRDAVLEAPRQGLFALSDENGAFEIPHAPRDTGDVFLSTSASRTLGLPAQKLRMSFGTRAIDSLHVRRDEMLLRDRCGNSVLARGASAVFGVLTDNAGEPLAKDTVWVRWLNKADSTRRRKIEDEEARPLVTDTFGRWYVCGLPREATVMFTQDENPADSREGTRARVERNDLLVEVPLTFRRRR